MCLTFVKMTIVSIFLALADTNVRQADITLRGGRVIKGTLIDTCALRLAI